MVLWNFDLLWKTMVQCKKLGYYGQNYDTILRTMELRFTNGKDMLDYQKLRNFDLQWKKLWLYAKIIEVFEQIYSFITLIYYGKTMILWKKLWYYGKNYDTIPKTMEL